MVRVAMTDMRLHGDGHSNVRCTDSLLDFSNYPDIHPESFDLVLTNPPFGSLLGPEALARLGRFEFAQGRRNVPLELLGPGTMHSVSALQAAGLASFCLMAFWQTVDRSTSDKQLRGGPRFVSLSAFQLKPSRPLVPISRLAFCFYESGRVARSEQPIIQFT